MTDTFDNRLVRVPIYTSAPEDPPASGPEPSLLSRFSNKLLEVLDQVGVAGLPEGEQRERVKTARNKLLHIGPMEEQDYLWPERMLRSAVTLPGDVATGRTPLLPPGLRREDLTDVPVPADRVGGTPYDEVIQRTQDTAGLAMTGGLAGTGGGGMVVGSGPVRNTPMPKVEKPAPIWYSPVEQALENSTQSRATGAQWLATLRNSRGVKPEELDWTGLRGFLEERAGQPVTRPELHEYLRDNRVELQDVTKGGRLSANWEDLTSEQRKSIRDAYHEHLEEEHAAMGEEPPSRPTLAETREWYPTIDPSDLENLIGDNYKGTKYHDYQLPGGENYREHLITMPERGIPLSERQAAAEQAIAQNQQAMEQKYGQGWATKMSAEERTENARLLRSYEELQKKRPSEGQYQSSHWDEPNIVAHVRSNVREMPEPLTPEQQAAVARRAELMPEMERLRKEEHRIAADIRTASEQSWAAFDEQIRADLKSGKIDRAEARRLTEGPTPSTPELEAAQRRLQDVRLQQEALQMPAEPVAQSKKTLHLEEVQSDWHQAGRRKGYALDEAEKAERRKLQDRWIDEGEKLPDADKRRLSELMAREKGGEVPDAPWKKTWHELALRRMIRLAAEEGMDRISWTPGEAQAARYDLSKQIDTVEFRRSSKDAERGLLIAKSKNGSNVLDKKVNVDELPDIIGKEAADKLLKQKYNQTHASGTGHQKLENADLKVGGEGMRGFYDKMMVQAAEKIGREYGVKVVKGELQGPRDFSPEGKNKHTKIPVWYFDIPPAMREAALRKGMPLFSGGKMFVPSGAQEKRSEEQ